MHVAYDAAVKTYFRVRCLSLLNFLFVNKYIICLQTKGKQKSNNHKKLLQKWSNFFLLP